MVALVLGHAIRYGVGKTSPGFVALVAVAPALWIVVFRAFGLYALERLTGAGVRVIARRIEIEFAGETELAEIVEALERRS